jgi:hypothetical protein
MRHFFIAALILYWPFIFFLAHVPQVPVWILRTQMSDKTLHYLGYLMLVFLWWFSFFPSQKPTLFSRAAWLTFAMMMFYGACDEWLQRLTHRTPDIMDWMADMGGVLTGLIIFGVAGMQLSALAVSAVVIFILTSLCKTDPLGFVLAVDIIFYIGAYGLVALLWIDCLRKWRNWSCAALFGLSLTVPVILLIVTLMVASARHKLFEKDRVIAAVGGIVAGVIIGLAVHLCRTLSAPTRQSS